MAAYNPLAALTPKQMRKLAARYANAQFGPVLKQINDAYAKRAQAGASSIYQGTQALASSLAPQAAQTHQVYAQAQSAQSAIDQAIAAKLQGAGQSLGQDVSGQLAAAGQNTAPGAALGGIGAGASAASFGIGSAALSSLVGRGAAAENYSASLPGIARLAGAQRGQDLALQLEHGRQGEVSALQAKIPGTIASLEQSIGNRELQKAIAVQSGLVTGARAEATVQSAKIRSQATVKAAKVRAGVGGTYNDNLSRAAGYAVDGKGKPIIDPASGRAYPYVAKPTKPGKPSKLTLDQIKTQKGQSIEIGRAWKTGLPATYYADGKTVKQPAQQAHPHKAGALKLFNHLVNHGYRRSIAAWAVGKVYGQWLAPGQAKQLGLR